MDWVSSMLADITAGRLQPRTHAVVRRLAEHERSSEIGAEVLAAFDAGEAIGNPRLLNLLWAHIDCVPLYEQGPLRTLLPLLRPDEPIDDHLADYLIGWAQDEGVDPKAIEAAFLSH